MVLIFHYIVGILNAAGWFAYYYFSGGWFESTETATTRTETVIIMILASIIVATVSILSKNTFNNPFKNIAHITVSTAICTSPFYVCITNQLAFWRIILCFVIWTLIYLAYFALFCAGAIWEIKTRDKAPWFARCAILILFIFLASFFPNKHLEDYIIVYGLILSLPASIILGIRNTYL